MHGKKADSLKAWDEEDLESMVQDGWRYVRPRMHEYRAFVKGRWLGRTILDVLTDEFRAFNREYYQRAIEIGKIRIVLPNTEEPINVGPDFIVGNNMQIRHMVHRHEAPIPDTLPAVTRVTDEFVAVGKPAGPPVHSCGRFFDNTLCSLIGHVRPDLEGLHPVHRLDRLTSGTLVFARSAVCAEKVRQAMTDKKTCKVYLAKIKGSIGPDPLLVSVSLIVRDAAKGVCETVLDGLEKIESDLPVGVRRVRNKEEVDSVEQSFTGFIAQEAEEEKKLRKQLVANSRAAKRARTEAGSVDVPVPKRFSAKMSHTLIAQISTDEVSGTSIVMCRPMTGRTHQIRLHLLHLGTPIVNDPCYGGDPLAEPETLAPVPLAHADSIWDAKRPEGDCPLCDEQRSMEAQFMAAKERGDEDDEMVTTRPKLMVEPSGSLHTSALLRNRWFYRYICLHAAAYNVMGTVVSSPLPPWFVETSTAATMTSLITGGRVSWDDVMACQTGAGAKEE